MDCPKVRLRDHFKRVAITLRGSWKIAYQIGRKAPIKKPYIGEWTHAIKNAFFTEPLRRWGIYNRKQRPENKCDGYRFPSQIHLVWRVQDSAGRPRDTYCEAYQATANSGEEIRWYATTRRERSTCRVCNHRYDHSTTRPISGG